VWQDVNHPVAPNGKTAYVKVTLRDEGSIVIRLKEKLNGPSMRELRQGNFAACHKGRA
jgi:hypothetical protein